MPNNRVEGVNWVDKQCKDTEWYTPPHILHYVREYYGGRIGCDPATIGSNPTDAELFFTKDDDGLGQSWGKNVFVNPPYGKDFSKWTDKIREQAQTGGVIIALLPCGARFSTRYFQRMLKSERLNDICFVKGRVKFMQSDGRFHSGNPYDSAIYGFNTTHDRFKELFGNLGVCIGVEQNG